MIWSCSQEKRKQKLSISTTLQYEEKIQPLITSTVYENIKLDLADWVRLLLKAIDAKVVESASIDAANGSWKAKYDEIKWLFIIQP